MISRRGFAGLLATGLTEAAFAQRAAVNGPVPSNAVWLNANEFPEGPPQAALQAMSRVIGESNRYHYPEFQPFYKAIAGQRKAGCESGLDRGGFLRSSARRRGRVHSAETSVHHLLAHIRG